MIAFVFYVHKKSVSKRKVGIIFIKNKKFKKTKKNTFLVGFFRCFFGFFLGGFFIANPAWRRRRRPLTRPSSRRWETRPSGCGARRTAQSRRSASPSSPRARFSSSDEPREGVFTLQLSRDYCSYNFLAKNTCNMCYVEDNPKNDPCV
jgi:hypothetical protein